MRQRWNRPPGQVAAEVQDSLWSLPGVPKAAYDTVVSHWRQFPPAFRGKQVRLEDVAAFMRSVLASDPFGTGLYVPYLDFHSPGGGKTVALTQKQLAFLVANALMGNSIQPGDGISTMLKRCSKPGARNAFLRSLLSLLAILSQELADPQAHGTTIVAATPIRGGFGSAGWHAKLASKISEPSVCSQVHGTNPTCNDVGDFMSGGNRFQALTDIAGAVVGGGGSLCEVANSQDESLVIFYSEVLALAFFVNPEAAMLPVPMAFLGVRRYMSDIQGDSSTGPPFFSSCGSVRERDWLNEDVHEAGTATSTVNGQPVTLAASSFVAVASISSAASNDCSVQKAMNNECWNQRNHLDQDLNKWYGAFSADQYGLAAEQAFRQIVRRIGTGPWGAGVWFGDSQQYFLAVWLATSMLAGVTLDYYVYDHFCENPANQCFLLGGQACKDCIGASQVIGTPVHDDRCGKASIWDLVASFKGRPAQDLYNALRAVGGPPTQVFDLLCHDGNAQGRGPPATFGLPRPAFGLSRSSQRPGPGEDNDYRWSPSVGGWGGTCTCPDGLTYEVGDNGDNCQTLACEFGRPGKCTDGGIKPQHKGMKVTCAEPASSSGAAGRYREPPPAASM